MKELFFDDEIDTIPSDSVDIPATWNENDGENS